MAGFIRPASRWLEVKALGLEGWPEGAPGKECGRSLFAFCPASPGGPERMIGHTRGRSTIPCKGSSPTQQPRPGLRGAPHPLGLPRWWLRGHVYLLSALLFHASLCSRLWEQSSCPHGGGRGDVTNIQTSSLIMSCLEVIRAVGNITAGKGQRIKWGLF